MLPTPCTSHVPYTRVYEPAEDSFLLLDTLSSKSETDFLASRFPPVSSSPPPLTLEIGPGSGVVLAFLTAHAQTLFSRRDILTLGIDVNGFACSATAATVAKAVAATEQQQDRHQQQNHADGKDDGAGIFLGAVQGDLAGAVRPGAVDVLVFNPPYVPTAEMPAVLPPPAPASTTTTPPQEEETAFERDSRLLALSYAGGRDGMETTARLIEALPEVLSDRGCAYLLLCAQNKPEQVKERIRVLPGGGAGGWRAETVGTSGKQAGWEKLQIVRIWRDS
jgi:release factor glutamine methyltransferase